MLPTHGRTPLRRFLLGSVTAKVLHDRTVPVWTGHPLHFSRIIAGEEQLPRGHGTSEMPVWGMDAAFGPYRDDLALAADARLSELKKRSGI